MRPCQIAITRRGALVRQLSSAGLRLIGNAAGYDVYALVDLLLQSVHVPSYLPRLRGYIAAETDRNTSSIRPRVYPF